MVSGRVGVSTDGAASGTQYDFAAGVLRLELLLPSLATVTQDVSNVFFVKDPSWLLQPTLQTPSVRSLIFISLEFKGNDDDSNFFRINLRLSLVVSALRGGCSFYTRPHFESFFLEELRAGSNQRTVREHQPPRCVPDPLCHELFGVTTTFSIFGRGLVVADTLLHLHFSINITHRTISWIPTLYPHCAGLFHFQLQSLKSIVCYSRPNF